MKNVNPVDLNLCEIHKVDCLGTLSIINRAKRGSQRSSKAGKRPILQIVAIDVIFSRKSAS